MLPVEWGNSGLRWQGAWPQTLQLSPPTTTTTPRPPSLSSFTWAALSTNVSVPGKIVSYLDGQSIGGEISAKRREGGNEKFVSLGLRWLLTSFSSILPSFFLHLLFFFFSKPCATVRFQEDAPSVSANFNWLGRNHFPLGISASCSNISQGGAFVRSVWVCVTVGQLSMPKVGQVGR